jgi:rhodanese-related sulfurtransferase
VQVHILDVRTPEEYVFVGHAEMAGNIPLLFVKHEWNAETNQSAVESKPDIITGGRRQFKPAETILVMCRSGDRGAMAVNALLKSWFCKRLQHHRWDGRGQGGRSHKQTLRKTDEERLEELRFALDV